MGAAGAFEEETLDGENLVEDASIRGLLEAIFEGSVMVSLRQVRVRLTEDLNSGCEQSLIRMVSLISVGSLFSAHGVF